MKKQLLLLTLMCPLIGLSSEEGTSFTFYYYGGEMDYITQGDENLISDATGSIAITLLDDESTARIEVDDPSLVTGWRVVMGALDGNVLSVGRYVDATRWPFNDIDEPGLSFSGEGRGCNQLDGWFDVLEIEKNGQEVTRLAANFRQNCENQQEEWSCGQIRYNSDVPVTLKPLYISGFESPVEQCHFLRQ